MADMPHNRGHDIASTNDHTGVSGATENNLMSFDANKLPKDSGIVSATVSQISSQPGAPSSTPSKVGLINIDETADIAYISTGTASSADWNALGNRIRYLEFNLVAPETDCAEGTNLYGDHVMKFSGTFLQSDTNKQWLMANNTTAGATGTMVLDIHLNGTTIMDTNKLDIETGEKTTETATTQPGLTTTAFTAGDILTVDIDTIHTTPAKEAKVSIAVLEGI
jgi:hypothetical protein